MKTAKLLKRSAVLLLAMVAAVGLLSAAFAEDAAAQDADLILAGNAAVAFNIRGEDGALRVPRRAPEMQGRGLPEEIGTEPDYRGVVGYASLQSSWDVSQFNTFTETPWHLPFYEERDGEWVQANGFIQHKTPVFVVNQELRESMGGRYIGYLKVVRLDTHRMVWIDVAQFVTVPYWTYDLTEAVKYGYCIAIYRDQSRFEPIDRKKHQGSLPDGIRVLMCHTLTARYFSPDKVNNPLLGIVFRSREKEEAHFRNFLFFNQEDLTLIY